MAGGALHGVDAASGEELWRLQTEIGDAFFSSPAIAADAVYIGSYDGIIVAAELATGVERWSFQAEGVVYSSPAVAGELVFVGDDMGRLYALETFSGEERWRFGPDEPFRRSIGASPAVVDGTLFIVDAARHFTETSYLHAFQADTGEEVWRFSAEAGDQVRSTVAVVDGRVHVLTYEGTMFALDVINGQEIWRFDGGATTQGLPAVSGGIAFFATAGGTLNAVDAKTADSRWSHTLQSGVEIVSSPTVALETVYFGDAQGILHAIDTASGDEQWQFPVRSYQSSPAILDGVMYVGGDNGVLHALAGDPERGLLRR
jgi:outer membrane protein assembly factor BamB